MTTTAIEPPSAAANDTSNCGVLGKWETGELGPPPPGGWQTWKALLGPGVLLAGASVGSGEWLSGPAISAQYGGMLLWVATLSIVAQVFCNLEMMRYTLYCGEPIVVGFFRTRPGPFVWTWLYIALDFAAVWPFNASNAAVPLAAAMLGHLPGSGTVEVLGLAMSEKLLVKAFGYLIFLSAFLPLIFGGTIYRMLERVMAIKLVIVLGYLVCAVALTVSPQSMREVCVGLIDFGTVPIRADTIVVGRHFNLGEVDGPTSYRLKGTIENAKPVVTEFIVERDGGRQVFKLGDEVPDDLFSVRVRMTARAVELAQPDRFYVETRQEEATLSMKGTIGKDRVWQATEFVVLGASRDAYARLDEVPQPWAGQFRELIENQGLARAGLVSYIGQHGTLPPLDWAMVATLAAIAGAGGMTNTLFSNYARDKGWGMGAHVGAIPSAIGGRQITLSHVGKVFRLGEPSLNRWRGWFRHILRDQLAIWMAASFIGMALPCMLSLEFIRHAPVAGDRVAAMVAEGMSDRYPAHKELLWPLTLSVGFLILAPGQIVAGDQLARRWTDIIWTSSSWAQRMREDRVKYVYYGILAGYGAWGLVAMALFDPLQILKAAGVLMNVALGVAAWHTLYVNVTLLPRALRPNWLMRLGVFACGLFFLGVSAIFVASL
ncbi:MAG TPA: Nramp family divalent metal transporter [Pirellulales bacterium]|jgi:Mn2+/Fe2+ NRAMP family transporter|nr:Nramp family divalent metal transporter [Pirellulales bacterium]